MPQYMIIGRDGPAGLERRKLHRPAHLAFWGGFHEAGNLVYAGPLLDEAGANPVGSLLIFNAPTLAEARTAMQADPYVIGGVFESTELRPVKQVLPEP